VTWIFWKTAGWISSLNHGNEAGNEAPGMNIGCTSGFIFYTLAAMSCCIAQAKERVADIPLNPISVSGLHEFANTVSAEFSFEYEREPIEGIQRRVVSFVVDELHQYALVLQPPGNTPDGGWPVLLMNHGHHPEPPMYGRIASGETDRPGDYYRALPLAFALEGFLVVVPDFRGHNDSQGQEFAKGPLESSWYSRDAVAAFRAIDSMPGASKSDRFMWGHSMGGAVTLRAVLALQGEVKGASIWSSTTTDAWKSSIYSSLKKAGVTDSLTSEKPALNTLIADIDTLPFDYQPEQGDATRFLNELQTPLSIHHSVLDLNSTPYHWSVELAGSLYHVRKPYFFHSYIGDKHLFEGENLKLAIKRDAIFFKNLSSHRPLHPGGDG
jgi:pimeloyl-ACP methyl ester carboxylesterase